MLTARGYTAYIAPVTVTERGPAATGGLQPQEIVATARTLISANGLAWFSMRKLAAALEVNPMTVYLRFDSKADLLDAVARSALAELELPVSADEPWTERAVALCIALRAHLIRDRNLLGLYASADRLSAAVLSAVEQGLALVEEVGYRDADAVLAFRSLFWHTVGFTLVSHQFESFPADSSGGLQDAVGQVDATTHPAFARHLPSFTTVDGDQLFTHTTRLLVGGLLDDAPESQDTP